jgi:NADH:ubiquinone oxidoreductase subunit 3 (subunit A)
MMDMILPILIALALVVIAWKVLKGLIKTVVLLAILAAAAFWVWQSGALA